MNSSIRQDDTLSSLNISLAEPVEDLHRAIMKRDYYRHIDGQYARDREVSASYTVDVHAERGAKVIQGAKKGHEAVYGSQQQIQMRRMNYRLAHQRLRQVHRSPWAFCNTAAQMFGVSAKTIYLATKDLEK